MSQLAQSAGKDGTVLIIRVAANKFDSEHIAGSLRRILGRLSLLACMAPPLLSEATRNDPFEFL
ncbi:MAG: hypothetical protein ACI8WM_000816, partial [Burkholderiaceae bacterium]